MKQASANRMLEEAGKAQILEEKEDVKKFLYEILEKQEFEQMKLDL